MKDRIGRFQLADGGTLLLDEVGEIPLDLQGKLLRVLQEGQIERVGDDETRKVDVRVIAATNRNLVAEVAAGRFRQDLYYRLSVFPIEVVPLRERVDDIPLLAQHFFDQFCGQMNRPATKLSAQSAAQLQRYSWPGNVRELQHVVQRAMIHSPPERPTAFSIIYLCRHRTPVGPAVSSSRCHQAPVAVGEDAYMTQNDLRPNRS